jgi:ribonuclease G
VARSSQPPEPIERQVFEGQALMVQVIKDPIGTKGARLSTQISIAGRLLVFLPQDDHIGMSQKIPPEQRESCARACRRCSEVPGRRRAASSCAPTARTPPTPSWPTTSPTCARPGRASATRHAPAAGHAAAPGPEPAAARAARPGGRATQTIRIDSREQFEHLLAFGQEFMPSAAEKLQHYKGERPIFDLFSIDEEIAKRAGPPGRSEVRRLPDRRPDRGADHGGREHRRLCRRAQL